MRISMRNNVAEFERSLDAFLSDAETIAAARALNVLQAQATVAGFRKINELYGVGPRTTEKYASVKLATTNDPEAVVTVKGKGYPLAVFDPIQTRRGVTAKIKGRRVLFHGMFLARMPNGHFGVFARGAYGGKSRTPLRVTGGIGKFVLGRGERVRRANKWGSTELPINELYSSSPGDTFANPDVVDAMSARVDEQSAAVIERELKALGRGF